VHAVDPGKECSPTPHDLHEVDPVDDAYFPDVHDLQSYVRPSCDEYVPGWQGGHDVDPEPVPNVPGWHAAHDDTPVTDEYVPAEHFIHENKLVPVEYSPSEHALHAVAPGFDV